MLRAVGDDDHALARGGDDLLPQESPAAALDQAQVVVELVGAVDRQVEVGRLVEGRQGNALALRLVAGRLGGGNAHDLQAAPHALADGGDEMRRRRAGAEAQPHAVGDELGSPFGRSALEIVAH